MSDTPNQTFKITVPITKCYKRTTADGVEKYVIEGMASNTNLDLTGERMADTAIKSMASSLATHPVVFKNEHGDEWDAEFGEVTALYATDDHRLMMEAELDPDHYRTKTLVKALEKGKSLGLSIGGLIPEGGAVKEWVSELGRTIKTYKDILLQEISVTGTPAVADTWLTNITKSVKDWKETPMPNEEASVQKTEEQTPELVDETPVVTPDEAPADEPHQESAPAEDDKSDAPEDESAPVEPEAPAHEEEAPASAEPAPEPADDDTSEVEEDAPVEDEVSKKLTDAQTEVETLTKSLTEAKTQVEELAKSLSDKTTELETVQKSLDETNKKLETIEARKSLAFQSGAKAAVLVDDEVEKSSTEPSIGELYLQKIGALPEAAS